MLNFSSLSPIHVILIVVIVIAYVVFATRKRWGK